MTTREEIEAAAARHGVRIEVLDAQRRIVGVGSLHFLRETGRGWWAFRQLGTSTQTLAEDCDIDTAFAAIARGIDEIAAVRVRTDTREVEREVERADVLAFLAAASHGWRQATVEQRERYERELAELVARLRAEDEAKRAGVTRH